jgi:hypothetical protein
MPEIESQWEVVKDCIRSVASGGPEAFKCLPACGPELEAVHLRACAAELKKREINFRRWSSDVSDKPEELIWRMRLDTQSGQLVWNVDRLGRGLHSEELAQAILKQLNEYCADYERELQSFYD